MGNAAPVAGDDRVLRVQELFNLSKGDINLFWQIFCRYDYDRIGCISVNDFFTKIVKEKRGMFGDSIFELVDTEDNERIEFGEFVSAVSTFCMFEQPEVLKFCFFIFDKDKNGYIDEEELGIYVEQLHQVKLSGNLATALSRLHFSNDGKFDFQEFRRMHRNNPAILYPAFRMQTNMMVAIGGQMFWSRKKSKIATDKDEYEKKELNDRIRQEDELEAARQRQIRKHMGVIKARASRQSEARKLASAYSNSHHPAHQLVTVSPYNLVAFASPSQYYLQPGKRKKSDDMYPPVKRTARADAEAKQKAREQSFK